MICNNTHRDYFCLKNTQADQKLYDPEFSSFKFPVRSCAGSIKLMMRPVQTKTQYYTDFGSLDLWKDSERPNKFMIQTLARSSVEKTQVDQKQIMIHTLPRYFLFALLGTFSHELQIKDGSMENKKELLSWQYFKKGYIRNVKFGNTK